MSAEAEFQTWLTGELKEHDIDDEVLISYICSFIVSDEPENEKKETVQDLLLGYSEDVDASKLWSEVLQKWLELQKKFLDDEERKEKIDVVDKVALIMEKQAQPVLKAVNRSSEEEKLREAILTRCTFVSSEEEEDYEEDGAVSSPMPPCQNQNAEAVVQAERDKRELQKAEAEKKKAQDKLNREKQKQKQEGRREKERKRTQKREHRR